MAPLPHEALSAATVSVRWAAMGEDLSGRWEGGRMAQNGPWEAASDADRAARHRYIAAPVRGHRSSFPLTCAARCRARCCSTLALATLTPISVAESLIEHPCKNRSSRIRR